jgi:predicted dehydrogenase
MKVRWGVLSTAKIGVKQVLPAMQRGQYCAIVGIASRSLDEAQAAAAELGIPRAYGAYEELLADPEIEAVYIPLPNHLHVPWSIRALEAGKHVLCEKPIGLSSQEAEQLVEAAARHPELKVMEAFMYRFHPQWQWARRLVQEGKIGELRVVQAFFSYHNVDAGNIRNRPEMGGGGLMDIGCYCISVSRWLFEAEPNRVMGWLEMDPRFGVDRLASGILDFGRGRSTWTCSTQLAPYQRVNVLGTEGCIAIEIPFNPPADGPSRIWYEGALGREEILIDPANHYTLQGDLFSLAVLKGTEVPAPLADAVANMKVIEAVVQSHKAGGWV